MNHDSPYSRIFSLHLPTNFPHYQEQSHMVIDNHNGKSKHPHDNILYGNDNFHSFSLGRSSFDVMPRSQPLNSEAQKQLASVVKRTDLFSCYSFLQGRMKGGKKPQPNLDDLCAVVSMEATAKTKDPNKLPLSNSSPAVGT
jgi:hypothetical protein